MAAVSWEEHEGILSCVVDGKLPQPFMYIDATNPPPWKLEPVAGKTLEFETEEAAKLALIINLEK